MPHFWTTVKTVSTATCQKRPPVIPVSFKISQTDLDINEMVFTATFIIPTRSNNLKFLKPMSLNFSC